MQRNYPSNIYTLSLFMRIYIKLGNITVSSVFLDNNIKRYDVGVHYKSVHGKRGKVEFSLCLSSVLHVITLYISV